MFNYIKLTMAEYIKPLEKITNDIANEIDTSHMPDIIIGVIGSFSDGKTTFVKRVTGKITQQTEVEAKKGSTIRLGYANCYIFKCNTCKTPSCYSSGPYSMTEKVCDQCKGKTKIVKKISFLDCPGHENLTSVMLGGKCIMDYTILICSAVCEEPIPAVQMWEHLVTTQIAGIQNKMTCINKVELLKMSSRVQYREQLTEKLNHIDKFIGKYDNCDKLVIPISALQGVNMDLALERLATLENKPRDLKSSPRMIVARSFDINNPKKLESDSKLKGGTLGGSLSRGYIKVGDIVLIYPGYIKLDSTGEITAKRPIEKSETDSKDKNGKDKNGKDKNGKDKKKKKKKEKKEKEYKKISIKYNNWKYIPVEAKVLSMRTETEDIKCATPGGLVGIQTDIDPGLSRDNRMLGNLMTTKHNKDDIKVSDKLLLKIVKVFPKTKSDELRNTNFIPGDRVNVHINFNKVVGTVFKFMNDELNVFLDKPVPLFADDNNVEIGAVGGKTIALCQVDDFEECCTF